MFPVVEHSSILSLAFSVLMIMIAIVVLIRVTAFWADDGPGTVFGAVRTIVAMAAAVYFAYDVSGYAFATMMQDPDLGISFPPHYSYFDWMREPHSRKWQVLGFVPIIRYLPVVFALCTGGIVQVLLWKVPFRVGMIIFINQVLVDIFAAAMLSFVFSFFVGVHEGVHADGHAGSSSTAGDSDGLLAMQRRIESLGVEEGPLVRRLWRRWESINQMLGPLYDLLQPVTRHLPLPARDFLNGGGWLIIMPCGLALLRNWLNARLGIGASS